VPIALAVLWMGVYPESFLAPMRGDVASIVARTERARPEGDAKLVMGKGAPVIEHGAEMGGESSQIRIMLPQAKTKHGPEAGGESH
jgi:NADH-quinone oxidoreductase subunit M